MRMTVFLLVSAMSVAAQSGFGPKQVISTSVPSGYGVAASGDIDGDGDIDVIVSSFANDKVVWFSNVDGAGSFGSEQVIDGAVNGATAIEVADLDGDGWVDVVAAAYYGNASSGSSSSGLLTWYRNLGGSFASTPTQVLDTGVGGPFGPRCVTSGDLDGDGLRDIVVAAHDADRIAWHRNLGGATFGQRQVISGQSDTCESVAVADINGDGVDDVLVAARLGANVYWFENNAGGTPGSFVGPHVINSASSHTEDAQAADLDLDGDLDVVFAAWQAGKIAWHENLGGGMFGCENIIGNQGGAYTVWIHDLDGDGLFDVLGASESDDTIAWYENQSSGAVISFGPGQLIDQQANGAMSVGVADLSGDGLPDVVGASRYDNTTAWYENQMVPPPPCPASICLDLTGIPAIGNTVGLWLQSPAQGADCYVFADTDLYPDPAGFPTGTVGMTTYYVHLALGPNVIPLADPPNTFGPSITNPITDATGTWSVVLGIPNDPSLVGTTFHGEAFVEDTSLFPNGLFHQSNLLSVTIQ